ncbi:hypothetical protein HYU40_04090 [Candidatus Woesearchaeota archaeon]|nr:hypothetical protein [Candidatus Woesearchaeota archaeon]
MNLIERLYLPLRQSFEATSLRGVGVDVDDTISATNLHWARQLIGVFGNPEGLRPEEIILKYGYVRKVPYWPKDDIERFVQECFAKKEPLLDYPVLDGALDGICAVKEVVPIAMYVSTRPDLVTGVTKLWLKRNAFPDAEVVCSPRTELLQSANIRDAGQWKAMLLEYLYPSVVGIIDDSEDIIRQLLPSYKGSVFFLSKQPLQSTSGLELYNCPTWHDIPSAIRGRLA